VLEVRWCTRRSKQHTSERIEPLHNRVLEALLDNVEAAMAAED
jgi:hypothetical protein